MQVISFFDGSYQFHQIKSDPVLNVAIAYNLIKAVLESQDAYRHSNDYWATIEVDGTEVRRYKFLRNFGLYRMDYETKNWELAVV